MCEKNVDVVKTEKKKKPFAAFSFFFDCYISQMAFWKEKKKIIFIVKVLLIPYIIFLVPTIMEKAFFKLTQVTQRWAKCIVKGEQEWSH
jgi:hypothetical protein